MSQFTWSAPSQDPTVRQPSHFTQFQQSRREVRNKESPGVKYKKNEMLAKNAEITGTWTAASSFKSLTHAKTIFLKTAKMRRRNPFVHIHTSNLLQM